MYMFWNSGLFEVSETEKPGYKPAVFTEAPEAPTGYEALFFWKETSEAWVQTWEVVPAVDEVDDAEALNILMGVSE